MQKTENHEMNLPDQEDFFDIEHFNENFQKIDVALGDMTAITVEETEGML